MYNIMVLYVFLSIHSQKSENVKKIDVDWTSVEA